MLNALACLKLCQHNQHRPKPLFYYYKPCILGPLCNSYKQLT